MLLSPRSACSSSGGGGRQQRLRAAYAEVVNMLTGVLTGNTTLKGLTLVGATQQAAQQVAAAVCRPSCGLLTLQFGSSWLLPVGGLLGKPRSNGVLTELDALSCSTAAAATAASGSKGGGSSSRSGAGGMPSSGAVKEVVLTAEQAVALTEVLRHCTCLTALTLGATDQLPADVLRDLVDAVMALPRLQQYNGMPVAPLAAVSSTVSSSTAGPSTGAELQAVSRWEEEDSPLLLWVEDPCPRTSSNKHTPTTAAAAAGSGGRSPSPTTRPHSSSSSRREVQEQAQEEEGQEGCKGGPPPPRPGLVRAACARPWLLGPPGAALLGRLLGRVGVPAVLDLTGERVVTLGCEGGVFGVCHHMDDCHHHPLCL